MTSSKKDRARDFGLSAAGYAHVRRGYPDAVFDHLLEKSPGNSHAVELGAGSGQATAPLSVRFDRVSAVEPDNRLTDQAEFAGNVDVINQSAEAVSFPNHSLDAVISATAFHWMDQLRVCAEVQRWLKPGGVFFPFAYGVFEFPDAIKDFEEGEQKKWAPYKDQRLLENYDYPPVLESVDVFASVEPYSIAMEKDYTPADAAYLIATTSFASAYARDHEGGVDAYAARLKSRLEDLGEVIPICFPINGAIGICA